MEQKSVVSTQEEHARMEATPPAPPPLTEKETQTTKQASPSDVMSSATMEPVMTPEPRDRQKPSGTNIYAVTVKALSIEECAQCHNSHFMRLKTEGAKHRNVACTDCHEQFHVYNPLKKNYADIMPKCSQCHDAPHGQAKAVLKCLNCHTDPHQPLVSIPDPDNLESLCRTCHVPIAQSLKEHPSKHTEQPCASCHSEKHGRIPACSECHESHSPMAVLDTPDCLACHPVHTPLMITYPVTQSKAVCAGCHDVAYDLLEANKTKHSALTCAKCHPKHGYLPKCQDCHGEPHNPNIHQKYPVCGSCHTIAHDLKK